MSYAQNFEDVMLRRALRDVSRGTYIDVGAAEPEADSVTKAFYDLGWSGINIEPLPGPFSRLLASRPRDINLNVAAGAAPGEAALFVIGEESGLSTLDPGLASRHQADGWPMEVRQVPVTTLSDVWAQHVQGEVHFLKVDAEGTELDVLRGADFRRCRPWVIVLEAEVEPQHAQSPSRQWDQEVLTPAGYEFAYYDGLNRFYVASERAEQLRPAFHAPPNLFDNFTRVSEVAARVVPTQAEAIARLEGLLQAAHERADTAQARVHAAQDRVEQEQARVAAAEAHAIHAQALAHEAQHRVEQEQARVAAAEAHAGHAQALAHAAQDRVEQEQARVAAAEAHARHAQALAHEAAVRASEAADAARRSTEDAASRADAAIRDADGRAADATAHAARHEAAAATLAAQADHLREERRRMAAERDGWAQELFETNRHAAELVAARQSLSDELARMRHHEAWRAAECERLHAAAAASHGEHEQSRAQLQAELDHASLWLDAVQGSTSWRVTRPIRGALRMLGRGG